MTALVVITAISHAAIVGTWLWTTRHDRRALRTRCACNRKASA